MIANVIYNLHHNNENWLQTTVVLNSVTSSKVRATVCLGLFRVCGLVIRFSWLVALPSLTVVTGGKFGKDGNN